MDLDIPSTTVLVLLRVTRDLRTSKLVARTLGTAQYTRPEVSRRRYPGHFKDLRGGLRMKIYQRSIRVKILSRNRYQVGREDSGVSRRILFVRIVYTPMWSISGKLSEANGACGHLHYLLLLGTTN